MPFETDLTRWSGEGTFTQLLIERLGTIEGVRAVQVEDAPATRSEADYNFISNELFVVFSTVDRQLPIKRYGIIPGTRVVSEKAMTLTQESKKTGTAAPGERPATKSRNGDLSRMPNCTSAWVI